MTSPEEEATRLSLILLDAWSKSEEQEIVLDFPPANLFPNRSKGKHWSTTHKNRQSYRELSYYQTKQQLRFWRYLGKTVSLDLTFEMPDKRHRDADNCLAAAKAGIDGMADALGVNDKMFDPITIRKTHGAGRLIVKLKQEK